MTDIDTDKWAKQLKDTGSTGIILTAKHHDGFCLFPSLYTDYTIAATQYRKLVQGDVENLMKVAESLNISRKTE